MSHIARTMSVATAAVLLAAGMATAQHPERATKVTFSAPVSLPGLTLPAGTYTFTIADSLPTRDVVQVAKADETQVLATILAVPAARNQPSGETVITFRGAPANMPPAVRYWYYPGDTRGQEFAYPRAQAMQIANATGEDVLAIETDSTDAEAMRTGGISRVSPASPAELEALAASDAAPPPIPATPPAVATRAEAAAPALPNTASRLPLVGLVGVLALGGALVARALRLKFRCFE